MKVEKQETQEQIEQQREQKAVDSMRSRRIILPVALSILAVGTLFWYNFDLEQFKAIKWDGRAWFWIFMAFVLLILRHFSYAFRLRALTGYVLPWLSYLKLIVLWEFSSALTPTSKGGPFVMMFALPKEGISAGRSTAAILYTMILDSGFFVTMLPLMLLTFGSDMIFPEAVGAKFATGVFFSTYAFMVIYWVCFVFFLFFSPNLLRRLLNWLSGFSFLKKYETRMRTLGDDFVVSAKEIKAQPWKVHLSAITGTLGAWVSKFLMINFIMMAVSTAVVFDGSTQAFIYARLVAMFIVLAFSFTPGGAGLAEIGLVTFISDFIPPSLGTVVALIWRGMAFYGYLLAGAILVPRWLSEKLGNK